MLFGFNCELARLQGVKQVYVISSAIELREVMWKITSQLTYHVK